MKDKADFLRELEALAPDLAEPEHLWEAFRQAAPASTQGGVPDPRDARDRFADVRRALVETPPPTGSLAVAWVMELRLIPLRTVSIALLTTAAMIALTVFAPPLRLPGHPLAWSGLLAPSVGFLWGLSLARQARGPWADWEAMAPLGPGPRTLATLSLVTFVALFVSALLALFETHVRGMATMGILSWVGPFALGSTLTIVLDHRWGAQVALLAGGLLWGVPLMLGAALSPTTPRLAAWLLWYSALPRAGAGATPDLVCLVLAIGLAATLAGRPQPTSRGPLRRWTWN